jgi:hypothetical protein
MGNCIGSGTNLIRPRCTCLKVGRRCNTLADASCLTGGRAALQAVDQMKQSRHDVSWLSQRSQGDVCRVYGCSQDWASCVLQQASRGELDPAAAAAVANGGVGVAAGALAPSTPRRLRVLDVRQQQQQQQQLIELQQLGGLGWFVEPAAGVVDRGLLVAVAHIVPCLTCFSPSCTSKV